MIDYFALALTHALILVALLRILPRPELDRKEPLASGEEAVEPVPKLSRREEKRARRQRSGMRDA